MAARSRSAVLGVMALHAAACAPPGPAAPCTTCATAVARAPAWAATDVTVDLDLDLDLETDLDTAAADEFCGVPVGGHGDVVFVIDGSGSMREPGGSFGPPVGIGAAPRPGREVDVSEWFPRGRFARAQKQLILALREVPDELRVDVVYFGDGVSAFAPTPVRLDPATRARAEAFVLAQRPFGGAALTAGLRAAYQLGAAQIIVLSDARVVTAAGPREVLLEARAQMARGVRFDAVVAGPDANRDLLTALAAESGGRVGELP